MASLRSTWLGVEKGGFCLVHGLDCWGMCVGGTHYPAMTEGALVHLRWWLLPLSPRSGEARLRTTLWRVM